MSMKQNSPCPICGGKLEFKLKNKEFEYKGQKFTIRDYEVVECNRCGEGILDSKLIRKNEVQIKDHHRQIDGLLTSEQIKRIRRLRKMTQTEIAHLVGGGIRSFSKYETGEVIQSRAMDNLLRVIERYPEVVEFLREIQKSPEMVISGPHGIRKFG